MLLKDEVSINENVLLTTAPAQVLYPLVQQTPSCDIDNLISEIVNDCREVILSAYDTGINKVTLEDDSWGKLSELGLTKTWGCGMIDTNYRQELFLNTNNELLSRLPDDILISLRAKASADYEFVAEYLFNHINISEYLIDLDAECPGTFDVLRFVPSGCHVGINIKSHDQNALEKAVRTVSCYLPFQRFSLFVEDPEQETMIRSITDTFWCHD